MGWTQEHQTVSLRNNVHFPGKVNVLNTINLVAPPGLSISCWRIFVGGMRTGWGVWVGFEAKK